jgi:hypothetical protein
MKRRWGRWFLVLGVLLLSFESATAQEPPAPLPQQVAPVTIPPEWGALRNVVYVPGNPPCYSLFFEDAGGSFRIVPLHLNLISGGWYLSKREPVAIIKRGP